MSRRFGIIDQAPSDASLRSSSQEIPLIVQKHEGHYRIHNSSSLVAVMSQMCTVFDLLFRLAKIRFNIIVLSGPILLCGSFHSGLMSVKFFLRLRHLLQCYMPRPSVPPFRHPNNIL